MGEAWQHICLVAAHVLAQIQCKCRGFPLTNFWGDDELKAAAGENLAYLDLYQVHYYDTNMKTHNPTDVFEYPAAKLVSSGKPIFLGEIPVSTFLCMVCTRDVMKSNCGSLAWDVHPH